MKFIYVIIVGIIFISGCSSNPTTQITAFGNATMAVTQKVDAVIEEYNNTTLRRDFSDKATMYDKENAKKLTMDVLAEIKKPISIETKKQFAVYKANKMLGNYAKALSALGSAGSQVDIDLAASKLYGSMIGLNSQYKEIKNTDKDLFNTKNFASITKLIAAIGHAIVENKRRAAIKVIVIQANPHIALICNEIINQLGAAGIEDSISESRKAILVDDMRDYKTRVQGDTTLDWRRDQIKRFREQLDGVFTSKLLIQQSQKAIKAVKVAHETLTKEVTADRFSSASISAAIGRLQDLKKHYGDFETLLLECKKISKNDQGVLSCDDK